jgi:hypothetical protein
VMRSRLIRTHFVLRAASRREQQGSCYIDRTQTGLKPMLIKTGRTRLSMWTATAYFRQTGFAPR